MLRSVPIVGWDVAFTPAGVFLLEVYFTLYTVLYILYNALCFI